MKIDRIQTRSVSLAAAVSLALMTSQVVNAQGVAEEIVVTGSYIKRDTFDAPSPTEVIDSTAVQESGAPSLGMFIRDLTFTQNTDTVSNVLGSQDGQQDSNSANFNIRGLGTGSTLTLFDGRRIVTPGAIGTIVPELALRRMDVVLDGGAALYGTDAVAGVVNLVPLKKFEGFKSRVYYMQDEGNDFHQPKYSMLAGTSFFDALDVVFAADYSKKTALYRAERPEYLAIDYDTSPSGNPGVYTRRTATGAAAGTYVDPACGTFNQGWEDHGMQGSYPSGTRSPSGCGFEYGQYQDFARPAEDTNVYLSTVYAINDKVNLEFQANGDYRKSTLITSPSTALTANNTKLLVPAHNPGNESGSALSMGSTSGAGWRPFTGYGVLPSHLDHRGATNTEYTYTTDRFKLGLTYDIGDSSWSGETWVSTQTTRTRIKGYAPLMGRMQAALNGEGGPNGNQYWNPFGNSDPRAPAVFGPTGNVLSTGYNPSRANTQEVVDWMWVEDNYESRRERLQFVESIVTGEVMELPAGTLAMAVGLQVRENVITDRTGPAAMRRDDYNTDVFLIPDGTLVYNNEVHAVFAELSVPILDNLEMQIAGRHEDFKDLNLTATSPKIAVRYEALPSLAFRASFGEGFLAPDPEDMYVQESPSCSEVFTGNDPFYPGRTGGPAAVGIAGATSCGVGNPNLKPEESEIYNLGFSWEIISDLEFSLDYQHIKYVDRIVTMTAADVLNRDFANFLAANGLTAASYNRDTHAALRDAWFASGMSPAITRAGLVDGINRLASVERMSENLSSNEVDVFDAKVKYSFDLGDFGYFSTQLASTYFSKYEYSSFGNEPVDGVGLQNGQTNLAPPLPQWKHNFRAAWVLGNHNAAIAAKFLDSVKFDAAAAPGAAIPDRISSYTTYDARYGYTFDSLSFGRLDFGIGVVNLTNAMPDRLPVVGGLETRLGDPFGRQYYAELNFSFE